MVVEVEEEVPVEHPRRLVGQTLSPELRVHCEPIQMRDPAAAVLHLERHAPGELPARPRAVVDLDHEASIVVRLARRLLDRGRDRLPIPRPPAGEVRLDLLVVRELDEEVDVLGPGAADADAHRPGSTAAARAFDRTNPEPSATPSRISPSPPASAAVIGSPRKTAP